MSFFISSKVFENQILMKYVYNLDFKYFCKKTNISTAGSNVFLWKQINFDLVGEINFKTDRNDRLGTVFSPLSLMIIRCLN